jgi:prepilin-type N-terminal cleavage/methylation domain-containing protein/prepilin-type processing-associated H-X9-DG protein
MFHLNHRISTKKTAFTLIELLVVIAIIAILAAILFPVFGRARENARRTSCQNTLKQIGIGFLQYYQDYDEQGPLQFEPNTVTPIPGLPSITGYSWDIAIAPYVGIKTRSWRDKLSFFQCPSDRNTATGRSYSVPRPDNHDTGPTVRRDIVDSDGVSRTRRIYAALSVFESPATTLMLAEKPGSNVWDASGADVRCPGIAGISGGGACGASQQKTVFGTELTQPSHLEGWNYLYMDGHVKFARPESTIGTGYTTSTVVSGRTVGVGQGLNSFPAAYTCSATSPCGPWTRDPND